jgi:hypothetical protein
MKMNVKSKFAFVLLLVTLNLGSIYDLFEHAFTRLWKSDTSVGADAGIRADQNG